MERGQLLGDVPGGGWQWRGARGRTGRRWTARAALALCAGALVAVGFTALSSARHDAELLQARRAVARRYAFTQALGFTGKGEIAKEESVSETCGFMEQRCEGLSVPAKRRCGMKIMCEAHRDQERCDAEDGKGCKDVLNVLSGRKPCYWDQQRCSIRPGWGDHHGRGAKLKRAVNVSDASSIMDAAKSNMESDESKEDDDAVTKVLNSLGASLTRTRHVPRARRKSRRNKVRLYSARNRKYRTHRYNGGVRSTANRQHNYARWKANYYQPTYKNGRTFSFKTGRYSDGTYPRGVYNNSYPSRREGRVNYQNGRRLARGYRYTRKPGKWEYVKYNHTYAHCHRPECRTPPDGGHGRFHLHRRFRCVHAHGHKQRRTCPHACAVHAHMRAPYMHMHAHTNTGTRTHARARAHAHTVKSHKRTHPLTNAHTRSSSLSARSACPLTPRAKPSPTVFTCLACSSVSLSDFLSPPPPPHSPLSRCFQTQGADGAPGTSRGKGAAFEWIPPAGQRRGIQRKVLQGGLLPKCPVLRWAPRWGYSGLCKPAGGRSVCLAALILSLSLSLLRARSLSLSLSLSLCACV